MCLLSLIGYLKDTEDSYIVMTIIMCNNLLLSSSTLVLDSRDRQGNVWLPYNAGALVVFKQYYTAILAVKLDWSDALSELKIYSKSVYTH